MVAAAVALLPPLRLLLLMSLQRSRFDSAAAIEVKLLLPSELLILVLLIVCGILLRC